MTLAPAPVEDEARSGKREAHARSPRAGALVAATGSAPLLAIDGSAGWTAVRVLLLGATLAAVLIALRSGRAGWAALTAAGAGLLAIATGGSIAFRYLSIDGWSVRAAAGLVTAVGGVVLLAVGTASALRAVRGWRRLLAVPAGLAVLYCVGFPLAIAVSATNVPRSDLGTLTPADGGLAYEDVAFATADGVTLSGWYIPSSNGAAVALLHGASSNRSRVLDHAAVLARHGYGVLLYDARGQGRSGGRAMNFGWYGDRDVAAAVDLLERRPDVDPRRIGAVGLSMGGEQAIGSLAADPRLRAVVAEGATNRVAADLSWLDDRYGVRGRIQQAVSSLTTALTGLLTDAPRPATLRRAVAAASGRPVLLLTAGTVADEGHAAASIRSASAGTVEVWTVPGAGHVGGLRAAPEEWERRVTGFLDTALR